MAKTRHQWAKDYPIVKYFEISNKKLHQNTQTLLTSIDRLLFNNF